MALLESLLTAIVRADGEAMVMHVGERPHVVASTGPVELSTQGLTLQVMTGMVAQLLPAELQSALTEFGAVEHELPALPVMHGDRFTVVVARGGDDVWIEIRRHRRSGAQSPAVDAPRSVEAGGLVASSHIVDASPDAAVAIAPSPYREPDSEVDFVHLPAVDAMGQAPVAEASPVDPVVEDAARDDRSVVSDAGFELEPGGAAPETPAPTTDPVPMMRELVGADPEPDWGQAPEPMAASERAASNEPVPAAEPLAAADPVMAPSAIEEEPTVGPESTRTLEPLAEEMHVEIPVPPDPQSPDSPTDRPEAAASASSASVIPMTRTLRIEVPRTAPSRPPSTRAGIERLLGLAAARGATALYLTTQAAPFLRVDDDVQVLDGEPPMTSTEVESAVLELMPDTAREALRRGDPTEWVSELADIGRVRCSTFRDYGGPGAIFQLNSFRPVGAEQLGLAPEIQALATETEGLVLVASPRGHGKSTLIGAFVDLINHRRSGYIITLERQIRLVHEHDQALISQREVRGTADQLLNVARAALSENADVLVIDELPSAEVFQLALDAAGSGRLVFASVTAPSITAALTRIVGLFPSDQRKEIQSLLAERLRGAVAQVLLRKAVGGRVAAREVLLATAAVGRVLAEGQLQDLPLAIDSGRKYGLVSLTDSLVQLVRTGVIDAREAYRKADDRHALLDALKRENVDTSLVERLA
jgi:twitching motility protein PilT